MGFGAGAVIMVTSHRTCSLMNDVWGLVLQIIYMHKCPSFLIGHSSSALKLDG